MRVDINDLPEGTRVKILEVITDYDPERDDVFVGRTGTVHNHHYESEVVLDEPIEWFGEKSSDFVFEVLDIENLSDPDGNY